MIINFKLFEKYDEKFKLGDRVLYCPLGKLESEDIYIVVGIKKSRRIGDMDSQQHILAKNEKTGLYKCLYFDRDIGLNEKYCWLNAYKFISEDEYSTIKYNL